MSADVEIDGDFVFFDLQSLVTGTVNVLFIMSLPVAFVKFIVLYCMGGVSVINRHAQRTRFTIYEQMRVGLIRMLIDLMAFRGLAGKNFDPHLPLEPVPESVCIRRLESIFSKKLAAGELEHKHIIRMVNILNGGKFGFLQPGDFVRYAMSNEVIRSSDLVEMVHIDRRTNVLEKLFDGTRTAEMQLSTVAIEEEVDPAVFAAESQAQEGGDQAGADGDQARADGDTETRSTGARSARSPFGGSRNNTKETSNFRSFRSHGQSECESSVTSGSKEVPLRVMELEKRLSEVESQMCLEAGNPDHAQTPTNPDEAKETVPVEEDLKPIGPLKDRIQKVSRELEAALERAAAAEHRAGLAEQLARNCLEKLGEAEAKAAEALARGKAAEEVARQAEEDISRVAARGSKLRSAMAELLSQEGAASDRIQLPS